MCSRLNREAPQVHVLLGHLVEHELRQVLPVLQSRDDSPIREFSSCWRALHPQSPTHSTVLSSDMAAPARLSRQACHTSAAFQSLAVALIHWIGGRLSFQKETRVVCWMYLIPILLTGKQSVKFHCGGCFLTDQYLCWIVFTSPGFTFSTGLPFLHENNAQINVREVVIYMNLGKL